MRCRPIPTDIQVRPATQIGSWSTDSGRFAEAARIQHHELLQLCQKIQVEWPKHKSSLFPDDAEHAAIWDQARKRDMLSDSVKIFSAMAVEGFLNFYGVVRLGQAAFDEHLERQSTVCKLIQLLSLCDGVHVNRKSEIVQDVLAIANQRNALVHAHTKEMPHPVKSSAKELRPVPGEATITIDRMTRVFRQFYELVPSSRHLLPDSELNLIRSHQ